MKEDQRDRERIEAGWELGRKPGKYQRDIVDMVYDDGLTNKEALEAECQAQAALEREVIRQEFGPAYRPKTLHRIVLEANREKSTQPGMER